MVNVGIGAAIVVNYSIAVVMEIVHAKRNVVLWTACCAAYVASNRADAHSVA